VADGAGAGSASGLESGDWLAVLVTGLSMREAISVVMHHVQPMGSPVEVIARAKVVKAPLPRACRLVAYVAPDPLAAVGTRAFPLARLRKERS
jgi:hypothetical protein